jgi:hypothetical protein
VRYTEKGTEQVKKFFGQPYARTFATVVHPSRQSLDTTWQRSWNMPQFHSECWMVASGVHDRLDVLSPQTWEQEACDHAAGDTVATQRLITHELVHVFHGQKNGSPDFSNTEGIDWFVEGLAAYASGQCDSARMADVRQAINDNNIPAVLNDFWTGKNRYGLSGSVVLYIDKKFGRKKILELLPFAKKDELLAALGVSEPDLIRQWREFMMRYK